MENIWLLLLLVILGLIHGSVQNYQKDESAGAPESDDLAALLGGLLQNGNTEQFGDIMSGLGTLLGQQQAAGDGGGGNKEAMNSLLSTFGSLFSSSNEVLPMLLQTWNSFYGSAAERRRQNHEGHADLVPPSLEKLHIFFDNFLHSDMGRAAISSLGAESFVRIFHDANGRFSYDIFMEKLENHSFRRHWISLIADKLTTLLDHVADPLTQKMYLGAAQQMINGYLRSEKYPKGAFLDTTRPAATITVIVNEFVKRTFNTKVESKDYIVPLVTYSQEIFNLAQSRMSQNNNKLLLAKLTDTINLDIIEPILRGNRAYRFAKNVHECDKYVMCLVNQDVFQDGSSLSSLKPLLSKGTTLLLSWFLSNNTSTQFLTYYDYIMNSHDCMKVYKESCHDFHLEEMKVTTEYVHNEL